MKLSKKQLIDAHIEMTTAECGFVEDLTHTTHTGEIVTGKILHAALRAVAKWERELACKIFLEDDYAPHVTADGKARILAESLSLVAENLPQGKLCWQRINTHLTGECVALLPQNRTKR